MSATTIGSLVVEMSANVARLQQDMNTATRHVKEASDDIGASMRFAKQALGALGLGLTINELQRFMTSAIDAAGAMNDLSKRTGISVERLSAWKLATAQSGTSMDALALALGKAGKYMVEHGDNLNKIGITGKTAEEVMLQLAGVISSMSADDPHRVALAMEVLGKSAGELLPLLSEGESGLRKMLGQGEAMVPVSKRLAEESDKFNDQLDLMKARMAAGAGVILEQMLPAMNKFLEKITGTQKPSDFAAQMFDELLEAQKKLARLKADQAAGGLKGLFVTDSDIERNEKYVASVKKRLDAAIKGADEERAAAAAVNETKANTAAIDSILTTQAKVKITDYQRLTEEVMKFTAAQQLELAGGDDLTRGQTLALGIMEQIRAGTINLTESEKIRLAGMLESGLAAEKLNLAEVEREKRAHEVVQQAIADYQAQQDALAAYQQDWNSYLGDLEKNIVTLQEQIDLYGLTATQIAAVNVQRAEEALQIAKTNGVSQDYLDRLQREVDLRKQILDKTGTLEVRQKWTDIFKSIDETAHDTFVSIFDSGKSTFDRLRDTLKNGLLDLLYQMTIKKWIFNIAAVVTGSGVAGTAAAAAGGSSSGLGGMFSGVGILDAISKGNAGIISGIENLGGIIANGNGGLMDAIGGFMGANAGSIATALPYASSLFSLLKGDIKGAALSAIGTTIGTALGGPVGGAIGAALSSVVGGLFGGGHVSRPKYYADTSVSTSSVFNVGSHGNSDASGTGGGAAITPGIAIGKALQALTAQFGGAIPEAFNVGTKYMSKYNSLGITVGRAISRDSLDLGGQSLPAGKIADITSLTFIEAVKKQFIKLDAYAVRFLNDSKITLDTATAALNSLSEVQTLYKSLSSLPPVFDSIRAAIENTLNLDNLNQFKASLAAVSTFYELFYSDAEKLANTSTALHKQFSALNESFPDSRKSFRDMVEGIDTTTASGLTLFNTLVGLAPSMDAYYKALEAQKRAIDDLTLSTDRYRTLVDYTRAQRYVDNGISLDKLPSFDVGTNSVPSDMAAQIHQGERIIPAADNAELMHNLRDPQKGMEALASEIRQLRAELRAADVAKVQAAQKTAKILDKFDNQGIVLSETNNSGVRVVLDTRTVP